MKECDITNCTNPIVSRGWCDKHYSRWRRHGDPHHVPVKIEDCLISDCASPPRAKGYCERHYTRLRRYGDPLLGAKDRDTQTLTPWLTDHELRTLKTDYPESYDWHIARRKRLAPKELIA